MFSILCKAHSQAEIISHTSKMQQMLIAHSEVMQHPNFARIELDDLRRLFTLYDIFFFERYFTQHYKGKISFYFSERMHSSAGIMCFHESERTYEIGIAVAMLFDNFTGNRGEMEVNGLVCKNRLEAMMRVLEHEAGHVIEYILYGNTNCQAPRFKKLVMDLFGHTKTTHSLLTSREIARVEKNISPGSPVTFNYKGELSPEWSRVSGDA